MPLNLSWDLFILVFFAVIIAYTFIIGRNQTLKVIAATYIAILCADGIGNLFSKYLASSSAFIQFLRLFSVDSAAQATIFFKVLLLIVFIVIIAVKGLFDFKVEDNRPFSIKMAIILMLGLLSGGLMISAMLIFVAGNSLISDSGAANSVLGSIYGESHLVQIMLDYSNLWFVLPGLFLVGLSILKGKTE